jgi:predicted RNA-binding protein Jag
MTAEELARFFHETYERLAPEYDYETKPESRTAWEDVPETNRKLMIATAGEVLKALETGPKG